MVFFFCDLPAQPNICAVLPVSQTLQRHSHSLENKLQVIVTTLCIINAQNGRKRKARSKDIVTAAQRVKRHISSFCL